MDTPQTFGQWLGNRRRGLDLTQNELAHRTGCARVTIKKLEADELRPSKQMADALMHHLDIPPGEREALIKFSRGGSNPFLFPPLLRNNLPFEISTFIGRERELAGVEKALSNSRLVTLTGVGGVGKTRISIEVGRELLHQFRHGVWFVEFAPVADPEALPGAALSIFKLSAQKGITALEFLQNYLRDKKMLLILDNCEHVIDSAARLAHAILRTAPGVKALATSREALNITGEVIWRVPSLSLPDLDNLPKKPEQLHQYESVQLFVERASLVSPFFEVNKENAPAVAQICFHLDGIPLAIELAAALAKTMTVEEINIHLDDRFRLLTGGSRVALPRQQTLRALIDWSYDLLSAPEKKLLQRISVFTGGWILDAAEQVCKDDEPGVGDVLSLLSNLVDKSLVAAEKRSGGTRYRILETIRQYALEKLLESGEEPLLRGKHLDYYLALTEGIEPQLKTPGQLEALRQLQMELDNIRAALGWSFSGDNLAAPEKGLRIACALGRFWELNFRFIAEGLSWYTKGLARFNGNDPAINLLRARSLCLAGSFASQFGDPASGRAQLEESISIYEHERSASKQDLVYARNALALTYIGEKNKPFEAYTLIEENAAIYRTLGNTSLWDLAESLRMLGWNYYWQSDLDLALARGQESLALFRQLGDHYNISDTIYLVGRILHVSEKFPDARAYYEECLSMNNGSGYKEYEILSIYALADLDRLTGDHPAARTGYMKALEYYRETSDRFAEGATTINLGKLALLEGQVEDAIALLRKGVSIVKEMRRFNWEAIGLAALADTYMAKGELVKAARWLGSAQEQSKNFNPLVLSDYCRIVDATRKLLDEKCFAQAWEEGRLIPLEQAVASALNDEPE